MREIVSPLSGIRSPFGPQTSALAFYAANGLRPTFVLDPSRQKYFVDGLSTNLAGAVTHSRASGATYLDSNGVLQTAASGEIRNQAYAYVDGVLTGPYVLTEPDGVNLLPYSDLLSGWNPVRSSLSFDQAVSPDGTSNATALTSDLTAANSHRAGKIVGNPLGAADAYTFSVWAKNNGTNIQLDMIADSANTVQRRQFYVYFDLQNGTAATPFEGGSPTNTNYGIEDWGNGWYRCFVTCGNPDGTRFDIALTLSNVGFSSVNPTFDGDGTSGVYLYNAQFEEGSVPTSGIPTSGSQGARAEDVLTIPDAPWPEAVATGPELVTNGTFDTDSDWTKGTGITITGGQAVFGSGTTNFQGLSQNIGLVAGALYEYSFDVAGVTGSQYLRVKFGEVGDTFVVLSPGTKTGLLAVDGSTGTIDFRPNTTLTTSNITIDNVSVREISPRAIGISMKGLMTGENSTFADWTLDANNGIQIASGASDFTFTQEAASVVDSVTGGSYTSGINVPFSIASYHKDNGINGAVDGVALTEDTTPTILPDLSATPIAIRAAGGPLYLEEMRIWVEGAVDKITDALIEEASA